MKVLLCLAGTLLVATASPQGYYHQEYNYKTSASSYKNNELQHQTDDRGYYSKSGDLEGRVKPKIKSDSEHSEYINPRLREGYDGNAADLNARSAHLSNGYGLAAGGSASSAYQAGSQYASQYGSQYGSHRGSESVSSSDFLGSLNNYYGSHGSSNQYSYSSSALNNVASRLQTDLQHELESAIRGQSQYSNRVDVSELESELRRNLTDRLSQLLQEQFGTQTIRGGQSYSLVGGRIQTRPNYEQQELVNLQNRLEDSLLKELRREYSYRFSGQQSSYDENYDRYDTTSYRPIYPSLNSITTTQRPYQSYPGVKYSYQAPERYQHSDSDYNRVSNVRYTPVPNPQSITTIASNVQHRLDTQLNRILEDSQYFSESSGYSSYNFDVLLDRLREELKNNITNILNDEIREQYGSQTKKDGYLYSVGSLGQISDQYNYNEADLESLRRQVENNLITKLNRDFESARKRWVSHQQSQSQSQYSHSSNQRYSNANYGSDVYGSRVQNSGIKTGSGYGYVAGSHQSGYETSGLSSSNLANLQSLQNELSRQLQAAITQNKQYTNVYSSRGGYGSTYDEAYQRLYEELQSNLTRQLQDFLSESGYSSVYGDSQLASLKSQLQNSLASQLQQGLQQTYSASASYSASSGSSASAGGAAYSSAGGESYRAARGYDQSSVCCTHSYRRKRSYGYRSRPIGLPTYGGTGGYSGGYSSSAGSYSGNYAGSNYNSNQQRPAEVGQEEDDSDLTQQVEPVEAFNNENSFQTGQQVDDSDTQQVEVDDGFTSGLNGANQQKPVGQELDVGQQEIDVGQVEDSDNTFGSTANKPNQQNNLGGFTDLQIGSQNGARQSTFNQPQSQTPSQRPISNLVGFDNVPVVSQPTTVQTNSFNQPQRPFQRPNYGVSFNPNQGNLNNAPIGFQPGPGHTSFNQPQPARPSYGSSTFNTNLGGFDNVPGQFQPNNVVRPQTFPNQNNLDAQRPIQTSHNTGLNIEPIGFQKPIQPNPLSTNSQPSQIPSQGPNYSYYIPGALDRDVGPSFKLQPGSQTVDQSQRGDQIPVNGVNSVTPQTSPKPVEGQQVIPTDDLGEQVEDTDFGSFQPVVPENVPKYPQYTGEYKRLSSLYLQPKYESITRDILLTCSRELSSTIQTEIPQKEISRQTYEELYQSLSNNITSQCQKRLSSINPEQYREIEEFLQYNLYQKLVSELLKAGFPKETLGVEVNIQPTTPSTYNYYSTGNRYPQNTFVRPQQSNIFIQREINSGLANNNQPFGYSSAQLPSLQDRPVSNIPSFSQTSNRDEIQPSNPQLAQAEAEADQLINFLKNSPNKQPVTTQRIGTTTAQTLYEKIPYLAPSFQDVSAEISDISYPEYKNVVQLDEELHEYIDTLINKQVQTARDNRLTVEEAYQTVLLTLEEEIQSLVRDTLVGSKPEVQRFYSIIKGKLKKEQSQQLQEYLIVRLNESVRRQLNSIYISQPDSSQSSYKIPSYEILSGQISNLTPGEYETIKQLDVELQKYVNKILENQVKLAQQQGLDNIEAYAMVLHTLEEQIVTLVQSTLKGSRPDLEKYSTPLKNKLTKEQQLQLREFLSTNLQESVSKQLTKIYGADSEPQTTFSTVQNTPSVLTSTSSTSSPVSDSVQAQISDLTPNQYQTVKDVDLELKKYINDLIANQVKVVQAQNLSPEEAYTTVLHTLEVEIESLVQGTVNGNRPELQRYLSSIRNSFNTKQYQELQQYLVTSLDYTVTRQLSTIYTTVRPKPALPLYQPPTFESIQNQITNLNLNQYNTIRDLDVELQKDIDRIIERQVSLAKLQHLSPDEAANSVLHTLEVEIQTLVQDTLQGNRPEQQKYSTLVHNQFSAPQVQELRDYLILSLTYTTKRQLTNIYNLTDDFYSVEKIYKPQYKVIRVRLENITTAQYNIIQQIEAEFAKQITEAVANQDWSGYGDLSSYDKYQQLTTKLEQEIQKNLTEFIAGTAEPGLSRYSDLIDRNFEKSKIPDVQKYLEIRLIKRIREQLSQKFNVNSGRSEYRFHHSSQHIAKFGQVQQVNPEQTEDIEPVSYQHATVVQSPGLASQDQSVANKSGDVEVILPSSEEPVETSTESKGWWSKFGSKVKSLKQKIVG